MNETLAIVRDGWSTMLMAQHYDTFFTITFRVAASTPSKALFWGKTFLEKYLTARRIRPRFFIVVEPHRGGMYHVHGLLDTGGRGFEFRRQLWAACFNRHGRCRFEPIRSLEAVNSYVGKYVTKHLGHWEMVGEEDR